MVSLNYPGNIQIVKLGVLKVDNFIALAAPEVMVANRPGVVTQRHAGTFDLSYQADLGECGQSPINSIHGNIGIRTPNLLENLLAGGMSVRFGYRFIYCRPLGSDT